MDWHTSAVVGAVTEVAARSTASVAASSMSRPVELSDSVKNGLNPLKLMKLPVVEAKDITSKVWPEEGLKPLTRARLKAPASVAVPVTATCPKRLLAGVPPIWSLSAPVDVWVKLPETVKMLPGPTVRLPLFVKLAPFVTTKVPLLEAKPAIPPIVAPAPPRVSLAWLLVMAVPLGNWREA